MQQLPSSNAKVKSDIAVSSPQQALQTPTTQPQLENGTLVMLVRNRELYSALGSMRHIEDRFNRKFHYPWTFINDEPFTDEFKLYTRGMASGPVEYAVIEPEEWEVPAHVDRVKANASMEAMEADGVIYGGSVSYRQMCRYNSGFFFRHPALAKYKWYWRVEPDIEFFCDVNYDPFTFMREHNKRYSFIIALPEFDRTIPTLWKSTQEFVKANPSYMVDDNSLAFLVYDASKGISEPYSNCHFWSNFEIADLDFWRSDVYLEYFDWLDQSGGFYYERWGEMATCFELCEADVIKATLQCIPSLLDFLCQKVRTFFKSAHSNS